MTAMQNLRSLGRWLKRRLQCKCMLDYDADGKPDFEAGWDGQQTNYGRAVK